MSEPVCMSVYVCVCVSVCVSVCVCACVWQERDEHYQHHPSLQRLDGILLRQRVERVLLHSLNT